MSSKMEGSSAAISNKRLQVDELNRQVLSIIAEVTRYPQDILQMNSHLEEDLGIDSVKRAEILAVLGSRLSLPEPDSAPPIPLRTIGDIVEAVSIYLHSRSTVTSPIPTPTSVIEPRSSPGRNGHAGPTDDVLLPQVIGVIADITRYPHDILKQDADLEEDLGIDLQLQASIWAALRNKLGLPSTDDASVPAVKTIGGFVDALEQRLSTRRRSVSSNGKASRSEPVQERPLPAASMKPFTGRIALVTGSGHGLGKVIAQRLAGLGATVVVNSFHSKQRGEETTAQIIAAGGQAVHLWGSVANIAQLQQIFDEIGQRFGGLDFFVSNASNGILAPLKDVQPEHWDRAFRTSVVALHQGSLLAAELMRRRSGGKIVAISSNGAQRYLDYFGCMGPVKAAVECLVRYLAVEFGADNIQVNAVTAGPIYGELLQKYPDYDKLRPRWEAMVPRGRLNDEQEVAEAVMFLLQTNGMSGSSLFIDAGGTQRIGVPLSGAF